MSERVELSKTFEIATDQLSRDQLRAVAREQVTTWLNELSAEGYKSIEPRIRLDVDPPEDFDPRYLVLTATLTAIKE